MTPFLAYDLQPQGSLLFKTCLGCDGRLGLVDAVTVDRDLTGDALTPFLARLMDGIDDLVWTGSFTTNADGIRLGGGAAYYESQLFGHLVEPVTMIRLFVITAAVDLSTNTVSTVFRWELWNDLVTTAPDLSIARSLLTTADLQPTSPDPSSGVPTPEPTSLLLMAAGGVLVWRHLRSEIA